MHDVLVCLAAVAVVGARSGQAHVYRRDVVGGVAIGACLGDEVDTAGHAREGTGTVRIEHLDRVEVGARRHTHDPDRVVNGGDRPGDVTAMSIVVRKRAAAEAVGASDHVEIGMRGIDTGINDRHVYADPIVNPIDMRDGIEISVDAVDPGRKRLRRHLNFFGANEWVNQPDNLIG